MRFVIIATLFVVKFSYSQTLDFGEVRTSSIYSYDDNSDSLWFGVGKIYNSKNELEIRLSLSCSLAPKRELTILTFNNNKWSIEKYSNYKAGPLGIQINHNFFTSHHNNADSSIKVYNDIFNTLKANDIFLLPDQAELKDHLQIDDGIAYLVSYKVGSNFRSYRYENPDDYLKRFKNAPEYKKLDEIITTLENLFSDCK